MLSNRMGQALNEQIRVEAESSQVYLSMASWSEVQGLEGVAGFMYDHSDEERLHMLKLIKYVNERGGHALVPQLDAPESNFGTIEDMFRKLYEHELVVSRKINELVQISMEEKDFATQNFLQWYVAEQIEEEALARSILDKINLIGGDKGGLYLLDRDIQKISVESAASGDPNA